MVGVYFLVTVIRAITAAFNQMAVPVLHIYEFQPPVDLVGEQRISVNVNTFKERLRRVLMYIMVTFVKILYCINEIC